MTTLRPPASLWRRARATLLAGSIALGSLLAPAGAAIADDTAVGGDGTGGAYGFTWEGSTLEDATAVVAADGEGLNLRAEPGWDGAVLGQIPDGTVVALRIDQTDTVYDPDGVTRWWPVAFDGQDGWVAGTYLDNAPGLAAGAAAFEFDGGSLTDATARVNAAAGLRLRGEPAADADVLGTIPDGTVVDLRIDEADSVEEADGGTRWWPVAWNGQSGWVSGLYLTSTDASAPATTPATEAPRGPFEWTGDSLEGATATAAGNGENVNVRAEPAADAEIVTKVADGALVNLRIADTDTVVTGDTRWWPVEVNGEAGWISGDLLTDSGSSIFPAGSTGLVQTQSGRGVKLRQGPGRDAAQIGSVPEGATITIVSGPSSHDASANGWFEIEHNGQRGYVDGDLLVLLSTPEASAPASSGQQPAARPSDGTDATGQPSADTEATQPARTATATATTAPDEDEAEAPATTATSEARPWDSTTPSPEATETPEPTTTAAAETPTPRPTQPPANSSAGFIYPVDGAVQTQGFGCSSLGFYPYNPDWGCGVHDGIDFAAPSYTPIHAVADGTVVTAGWCDCGLGYYVEIDHGGGIHTLYGHMATQPYVSAGQHVTQGQEIGPVGSTGLSTGPHTHFMVQVNGVSQDPARYLP